MNRFNQLLQTLLDKKIKPKFIIGFCESIQGYQRSKKNYECAPSIEIKRRRYDDYARHHANVKYWLSAFDLENEYKPEDFIEE